MRYDSTATSDSLLLVKDSARPALTHNELQRLVRYWVGLLKEAGLPPEEVLIAVKALVRETVVPRYGRYRDSKDDGDARLAFVRDASQWCIDAYFEDAAEPNDPAAAPSPRPGPADSPSREATR